MYFCTRNISRESWDKMSIIKKKKQFSTIYGSYKPILGFPAILKTKPGQYQVSVLTFQSALFPCAACSTFLHSSAPDTTP